MVEAKPEDFEQRIAAAISQMEPHFIQLEKRKAAMSDKQDKIKRALR